MTPIDDSVAFILPRLALVVVLAATAAVVESPARATHSARVLRVLVLATLGGAALAGMLAGPFGPLTGANLWAHRAIDPMCCESVSVQLCAADHDLRLLR